MPPLLNKISPHRSVVKAELVPIKGIPPLTTDKNQIEHIDVEASLEAHTTPVLINKSSLQSVPGLVQKTPIGAPSPTTSVKVSTSSGIQTVHVSVATTTHGNVSRPLTSLLANSAAQSVLMNQQNRAQSPNVVGRIKKAAIPPGKQPILIQNPNKAPPLLTQTSSSGQSYIIPFNLANTSGEPTLAKVISSLPATTVAGMNPKLVKTSIPPALTSTLGDKAASSSLLGKNAIRVGNTMATKSLINPAVISLHQQKVPTAVSTVTKASTLQKGGALSVVSGIVSSSPTGIVKGQQQQLTPTQQKQILQNIIAQQQQQKRLVQNAVVVSGSGQATQQQLKSIIVAANQAQGATGSIVKIVTSTVPVTTGTNTVSMPGGSLINPQIIQIQQTSGGQNGSKMQTMSTANLTPQQQQNLFNTLRQQQLKGQNLQANQPAGRQQSLIIKQHPMLQIQQKGQVATSQASQSSVVDKVTSVVTTATTTIVSSAVTQTMARKPTTVATVRPATTVTSPLKVLTNQSGQLISLESLLQKQGIGTPIRVAGAKAGQTNLIQLAGAPGSHITQYAVVSPARNIISVATPQRVVASAVTTTAATARMKVATATAVSAGESGQPKLLTQKVTAAPTGVTKAVAPSQAMVNAKLLGVQNIAAGKMKPGIRMVNASNLNIAHIGGKPVIIASKSATPGQSGQTQGVILQSTAGTNGANLVIGGQTLKVQSNSLNLISPTSSNAQTVMIGNQLVKVQQPQQISGEASTTNSITATGSPVAAASGSQAAKIIASSSQASPQTAVKVQAAQVEPQQQQSQMILGAQVKKANVVKGPSGGAPGQQRVVLALQSGGQILLPPGFQGGSINLKTLQGLKMISIPQQQQQQQPQQPQQSPQATQAKGKSG
uniref:Uncharacterized protein n=2 Tax=Lutzomyia longipalpis TaxID=7200 RepID=A0A1B0CAR0_LUTLO